jgi:hypothetical protein
MTSSQALADLDWRPAAANANVADPAQHRAGLEDELQALEPVISAAVLAGTAFRLRDETGLIDTLRLLTQAVDALEVRRAREDA